MSKEDIDDLVWKIMIENAEYDEIDRMAAINGVIDDGNFLQLSIEEQNDVLERLAIGIGAFNAAVKNEFEKDDLQRLPDVKISGKEE